MSQKVLISTVICLNATKFDVLINLRTYLYVCNTLSPCKIDELQKSELSSSTMQVVSLNALISQPKLGILGSGGQKPQDNEAGTLIFL